MHLLTTRLSLTTLAICVFTACTVGLAAQHVVPAHTPEVEAARLNNIGTALMGQQLLDRAATTFAEAAKADPKLTLAKVNEGIALLYLQRLPEA